jgi:hypothetical protein
MKRMFDESLELAIYKCIESIRPEINKLDVERKDARQI